MNNKVKGISNFFYKTILVMTPQQRKIGIIVFLLTIINAVLQMTGVYIIVPLVNAMTTPDAFMHTFYIEWLCSNGIINSYSQGFIFICLISIFIYIIKDTIAVFQIWINNKFAFKIQRELSVSILKSYINRVYDFFLEYGTPKIIRDTQADTSGFNQSITAMLTILTESFTMLLIVVYIFIEDWKMGVCIMLLGILCMLILFLLFKPRMKKSGEEFHNANVENKKILLQAIEGVKEVQIMRKQDYFLKKYEDSYRAVQKPQISLGIGGAAPVSIIEGAFFSGLITFICLRSILSPSYNNSIAILASYVMGAVRIMPSLGRMSSQLNTIIYNKPSVDNLYNVICNLRKYEKETPLEIKVDLGKEILFNNSLTLNNISWHYASSSKNILSHLNLSIKKGQSVGIIGASGAGKSTLADIILGLHIPQIGTIELDGMDIKEIPFEYSRVIGYVPQTVYLVDGSVRENVAFGVDNNEIDDKRVWQALKQAQIDNFVNDLENGLETVVGERGVKFSGGQRQRLAIARALYRNPQILVLDEATSALDNETEKAVMDAIESLYGTITIIVIAHRLTTVKLCDVIYEITDGKAQIKSKEQLFK